MGINATFIFADNPGELNTSLFRCAIPAKFMRLADHVIDLVHTSSIDFSNLFENVLLERVIFPESNSPDGVKLLRKAGVKNLVATFDDAYHLMPDVCKAKEFWSDKRVSQFKFGLSMCDLVIVPSYRLAEDYSQFCNIQVVDNFLDDGLWPTPEHKEKEVVTIGWGGSDGHLETWKKPTFLQMVRIIKKKYGKKVNFIMVGKVSKQIIEQNVECSFVPRWIPFGGWPEMVRSFDIGIAPLSGAYDMRRSKLKVLEYAAAGIPFVASNKGEYARIGNEFADSKNYLCDTVDDWVDCLSSLIDNGGDFRNSVGKANREWAEGYMMSKHTEDYASVLSN